MKTVDLHEAEAHFTSLIEAVSHGEDLLITRAGTPFVRVTAAEAAINPAPRRLGFLDGQFTVPDDFDTFGQAEIEEMFGVTDMPLDPDPSEPRGCRPSP